MFTGQTKDGGAAPMNAETFIGPSVKLEGNFSGDGDVVVEGILVGTLNTRGDVRIGGNAVIEAAVSAKNATVAGKIKGNLNISNELKLTGTASITGDIRTGSLAVEQGAVLNGKILMGKEKNTRESKAGEFVAEPKPAA